MINCSHVLHKGFRGMIHGYYVLKAAIYNVFVTISPSIFINTIFYTRNSGILKTRDC